MFFGGGNNVEEDDAKPTAEEETILNKKASIRAKLAAGELENELVTVEIEEQPPSMFDMLQGSGMEQMGLNMQDALSNLMPKKKKKRKMKVSEARIVLTNDEASKLID